jgi:hypothetical protein
MLRANVKATEREAQGVISAWEVCVYACAPACVHVGWMFACSHRVLACLHACGIMHTCPHVPSTRARATQAKVAQLNDDLEDARTELDDAQIDKEEALAAVKAEAEERFQREVGLLRGALDKLRSQVSATTEQTEMRGQEAAMLEEEKLMLENELLQMQEERDQVVSCGKCCVRYVCCVHTALMRQDAIRRRPCSGIRQRTACRRRVHA